MFLLALIIAVLIGFLLRGSLKNIDAANIKGLYFVFIAVVLEFIMIRLIKNDYLAIGALTYCLDLVMYAMLLIFIYLNRRNKWIILVGVGVVLNAVVIFSNGGAMPVNIESIRALGFTGQVSSQGLYVELHEGTWFKFLADIIPIKYPKPGLASIGDIVEVIGLALYVISEMQTKKTNLNYIKLEQ
jgi:uncharacterized membrane protein